MISAHFKSPIGWIEIKEDDSFIVGLDFCKAPEKPLQASTSLLLKAAKELEEYFDGQRKSFSLPLQPQGTQFQQKSWNILQQIPYGKTISYQEQAEKVGGKNYSRAVGGANGKNPIAIVIPCHRVIGKTGKLTGFASGVDKKKWLLDFEAGLN